MAMFMCCEQTNDGMATWTFSHKQDLSKLIPDLLQNPEDMELLTWLLTAKPGEHFDHRLGMVFRLADEETVSIPVTEYQDLKEAATHLKMLICKGVDNLEGYTVPPSVDDYPNPDDWQAEYDRRMEY